MPPGFLNTLNRDILELLAYLIKSPRSYSKLPTSASLKKRKVMVALKIARVILIPEYGSMPKLNCFASLFTLFGLFLGFSADGSERPNIFWITSEDNNVNWVGCYGNPHAQTPYIDKLASEGFQYMNCFANAPVCAPSRSGWITGVHPVSLGTLPMRSRYPSRMIRLNTTPII